MSPTTLLLGAVAIALIRLRLRTFPQMHSNPYRNFSISNVKMSFRGIDPDSLPNHTKTIAFALLRTCEPRRQKSFKTMRFIAV